MTKDGYYTSGEFAKKANVTLRTIRYYDRQGILKPSKVADNGYRLYTDADFAKLQKILSLKYLGFSLEEIMTMTINDEDQDFIKESIGLQLYLVQKKMEHLKLVEQSLEEMEQKMDNEEEIDWTQMMNLLHVTNLEKGLVEQYKNASNLDIRIGLHQKYSQNPQPWFEWIYEQLNLKEKDKVLELGCGTGLTAIELAKEGHQVLATDLSEDMVNITALKAKDEGVELLTETIDMCDFALSQPVDTILCLTDAINYVLSKKKVQDVFNNVYEGLKYNGTFIFDVNSLYKCNVILDDYHEKNEDEDFFFSWDVESDHKGGITHHIIIDEDGHHVDETHRQKTLPVEEYVQMLKKAGFTNVKTYGDFTFEDPKEDSERIFFVCKK